LATGMQGRRILVTGAGGGIGGATADELARLGAVVLCADVHAAATAAVAARTGGVAVPIDLADVDDAERAVRTVAPELHGIVHAAGIGPRTSLPAVDEAESQQVLQVNLSAAVPAHAAAVRRARRRRRYPQREA
jgi:NAD(P)-dependent dehydrogenase (short-subunit alcohol dehydrogenase family)